LYLTSGDRVILHSGQPDLAARCRLAGSALQCALADTSQEGVAPQPVRIRFATSWIQRLIQLNRTPHMCSRSHVACRNAAFHCRNTSGAHSTGPCVLWHRTCQARLVATLLLKLVTAFHVTICNSSHHKFDQVFFPGRQRSRHICEREGKLDRSAEGFVSVRSIADDHVLLQRAAVVLPVADLMCQHACSTSVSADDCVSFMRSARHGVLDKC
jgi:hypothetical protein